MPRHEYEQLANRIKLLAHPERLRILDSLRREAECVCHLEALLDKPQPYVSQQLRILREAGVIQNEQVGHNVYYHLIDPEVAAWLAEILGPAEGEHPDITPYKQLISCDCPKCEGTEAPVVLPVDPISNGAGDIPVPGNPGNSPMINTPSSRG